MSHLFQFSTSSKINKGDLLVLANYLHWAVPEVLLCIVGGLGQGLVINFTCRLKSWSNNVFQYFVLLLGLPVKGLGSGSLCLVGEVREAKPEKSGDKLNLMNERMKKRSGVVDTDLSGIELLCRVRTEFISDRNSDPFFRLFIGKML